MKPIDFAENLVLPAEFVTQPCAILARRGWGKTYTAKKLVEGLFGAGAQVIVVDPVGVWYGLRTASDGRSPGLPILVFGGHHGDVELHEDDAPAIARVLVESSKSAVLDVSLLRKAERQRFVGRLAEHLLHLKKSHRSPVHVVLEEAQLFAPQQNRKGAERMLGAIEDLCRLGRNFGIGYTLVSQRPQTVNKEVLSQAEVLIVGQISGPHERKAVEGWIVEQGLDVADLVADLPSLQIGEAFLWSPSWLRVCERIRIGEISTYDSSSTPVLTDHVTAVVPQVADVDVIGIREALAAAGAEARADDPRQMKRRLADLERQLAAKEVPPPEIVEVSMITAEDRNVLFDLRQSIDTSTGLLTDVTHMLTDIRQRLQDAESVLSTIEENKAGESVRLHQERAAAVTPPKHVDRALAAVSIEGLPRGEGRVLSAIVQSGGESTGKKAALLSGYSLKSSTMRNICSKLRRAGLIEGTLSGKGSLTATPAGLLLASDVSPLPKGQALQDYWLAKIPGGAPRAVLQSVLASWPDAVGPADLERTTQYSSSSSTMRNALSKLRTLDLVVSVEFGMVRASSEFFDQ